MFLSSAKESIRNSSDVAGGQRRSSLMVRLGLALYKKDNKLCATFDAFALGTDGYTIGYLKNEMTSRRAEKLAAPRVLRFSPSIDAL
jgi:hypothetical protein